jgi:hypothetical protein
MMARSISIIVFALLIIGAPRGLAPTAAHATLVSGNQSGVWDAAGSPYIVTSSVTVPLGQTLTIMPAVVVRTTAGGYIQVFGTLTAAGTPTQPVTFTSRSDSTGGSPHPGDWQGLFAEGGSTVDLQHTCMRLGGGGGWANLATSSGTAASISWVGGCSDVSAGDGIRVVATNVTLTNLNLTSNAGDGVELTCTNPPLLDLIDCDQNGGAAFRVNSGVGSFPATLSGSGNGTDGIVVGGTLGGSAPDQTWRWDVNPSGPLAYVIPSTFNVFNNDTLELAGCAIKLSASGAYLQVSGAGAHLRTISSMGNRVRVTSIKDDTIAGDTNGDGGASSPAPGDWAAVFLDNGCTADLENLTVRYGGGGSWANLATSSGTVTAFACSSLVSEFSANDGVRVSCIDASVTLVEVSDNGADGFEITPTNPPVFAGFFLANRNAGYAMRITQNPGSFPESWAINSQNNGVNGIYVTGTLGGAAPAQTWTWRANQIPYVIGTLSCSGPDSLEIDGGAVVKFDAPGSFLQIVGAGAHLRTLGTSGAPVWFTSRKDDAQGGDTNNDGAASSPAGGDWAALFVDNGAAADLAETWLAYGGGFGWANVAVSSGVVSQLSWNGGGALYSANDGVRASCTNASLANLTASGNALDGLDITPTFPPAFDAIVASNNGGYGIRVTQNAGSFPGNITGSGNAVNGIYVTGTLGGSASDRTWSWGANPTFPYVIGTLSCSGPDSLEMDGGAVVKFDAPGSFLQIVGAGAHLRTLGTSGAPVRFTSRKDDSVGGDTNNDGAASSPAGGDWTALFVNNSATADLNWTELRYGGGAGWANLVSSSGVVSQLAWNGGGASYSANDGVRVACTNASLANLTASGNAIDGLDITPTFPPVFDAIVASNNGGYGIRVTQNAGSFPGNITGSGNGVNGIYVTGTLGGAAPAQTWTWRANQIPYVIGTLSCSGPDSLEIDGGAVVKFDAPGSFLQIVGAGAHLRTLGTSGAPVWFTSRKDDAQGGDTNNDGAASSPAGGDWTALFVDNGAAADLAETWLAYGGGFGWANVAVSSGSGAIAWNGGGTLRSADEGLSGSYTTFALNRVRVAENIGRGISVTPPAGATATGCDFYDNDNAGSSYGFYNVSTTVTVDATSSWWGDASGPFDPSPGPPSINSGGLGERVSDYINYGSWLSAPNTNQPPNSFVLLQPGNGGTVLPTSVTFAWRSAQDPEGGAITYDLVVDDDPAFASPIVSVVSLADTSYDAGNIFVLDVPIYWKVTARDGAGAARLGFPAPSVFTIPPATGVDLPGRDGSAPAALQVFAPYPNPFHDASTLAFSLPEAGPVRIDIFDVSGRLVHTIADGAMPRGAHSVAWDGQGSSGRPVGPGVYFYRLATGLETVTRRTVLSR